MEVFSFDEITETIDAYVTHIRQVAAHLGLWRTTNFRGGIKTHSHKIVLDIVSYGRLRQVVETAKRILTKEKLDRQLTRQSSSTPFMSIREGHNRKVSFDTKVELGDKRDKLVVMIDKLATRDNRTGRQFKPQINQS